MNEKVFRNLSISISGFILIVMTFYLMAATSAGSVVLMPFCGFPPIVAIVFSCLWKSLIANLLTVLSSIFYVPWFVYVVRDAFVVNIDPQSGLVMIFVGIFFLPVLLPLWGFAWFFEHKHRKTLKNLNTTKIIS